MLLSKEVTSWQQNKAKTKSKKPTSLKTKARVRLHAQIKKKEDKNKGTNFIISLLDFLKAGLNNYVP